MKEGKKSFIVYTDIKETLDKLTDEQAGKLIKGMVHYSDDGTIPEFGELLEFIFIPIRQQMDRDEEKWNGIKTARSIAGKKGGQKSAQARAEKRKALQESKKDVINSKQKQANVEKSKQKQANQPVNVNVNVNDNVNVNVNDNVIQLSSALLSRMGGNASQDFEPDETVNCNIAGLLNEGYTEEDMFEVVDAAWMAWKDDSANVTFYNPHALFGDMFKPLRRQLDDIKRQKAQVENGN